MRIFDIFAPLEQPVSPQTMRLRKILIWLVCFLGGTFYAASLPPFNLFFLAAFSLLPLLYFTPKMSFQSAFFHGWSWGIGWSVFAFQFLREIDPVVPYLMAPVISLWPGLFSVLYHFLSQNTLIMQGTRPARQQPAGRLILCLWGGAALFVFIEWTRSRLFPWNDFSVPLWRLPVMLQIADLTGHYGVNWTLALANSALAALLLYRKKSLFFLLILPIVFSAGYGFFKLNTPQKTETFSFSPALIQGNLSQRRRATLEQAQEALRTYVNASEKLLSYGKKPDIVLWPEGAVPVPFYSAHELQLYRQTTDYGRLIASYQLQVRGLCQKYSTPFLIGALDFAESPGQTSGATNSALFFDNAGSLLGKYDKFHRVPFGEYIPFRSLLPGFLIRYIDMGRDLVPGKNLNPMKLNTHLRAGTAVCYEGIFSYVMRTFARRGANVFIVLSNDAWYPRSSEPEQHLANAVLRAVETRLPMIRCGNNGGSGVVFPDGHFKILDPSGKAPRPELLRCAAAEKITIPVPVDPERTVYVRYGEWFILLLAFMLVGWMIFALHEFLTEKNRTLS